MGALEKAVQERILLATAVEALDGGSEGNVTGLPRALTEFGQSHGGMVAGEAENEVSSTVVVTVPELDPRLLL